MCSTTQSPSNVNEQPAIVFRNGRTAISAVMVGRTASIFQCNRVETSKSPSANENRADGRAVLPADHGKDNAIVCASADEKCDSVKRKPQGRQSLIASSGETLMVTFSPRPM